MKVGGKGGALMASTYFIRSGQAVPSECLRALAQGAEITFGDRAERFQQMQKSERGGRDNGLVCIAAARVADLAFPPTIMRRAVLTSAHTLPYTPRGQEDLGRWTSAIFDGVRLVEAGEMPPLGCNYLIAEDAPRDGLLMIQWGDGVDSAQVLRVARQIEEDTDYALKSMR
jgi:hypothetical protein